MNIMRKFLGGSQGGGQPPGRAQEYHPEQVGAHWPLARPLAILNSLKMVINYQGRVTEVCRDLSLIYSE